MGGNQDDGRPWADTIRNASTLVADLDKSIVRPKAQWSYIEGYSLSDSLIGMCYLLQVHATSTWTW
jgi:hypothetical protein